MSSESRLNSLKVRPVGRRLALRPKRRGLKIRNVGKKLSMRQVIDHGLE